MSKNIPIKDINEYREFLIRETNIRIQNMIARHAFLDRLMANAPCVEFAGRSVNLNEKNETEFWR